MEAAILLCAIKRLLLLFLMASICHAECHFSPEKPLSPITKGPELLVFVSFGMPAESLKLWSRQAAKVKGKLLIRGFFENSLERTTAKTLELFGEQGGAEVLIDPEAFSQFNIQAVPAVVVSEKRDCLTEDCPIPVFDVVYGDISLKEALRLITVKGSLKGKQCASLFLKQYRESHE